MEKGIFVKIIRKFGNRQLNLELFKRSAFIPIDKISIPINRILLMEQIHSDQINIIRGKDITKEPIPRSIPNVDGLITNEPDIFLAIKTADCIPIFMWDETIKVIAALHSGRKGTELNIAGKAVKILVESFNCNPVDIRVDLGPAICGKCYEVDEITFRDFVAKTGIEQYFPNLDLKKVVKAELQESGISEENIFDHQICTKKDSSYFSYRENGTKERQISLIGMC